MNLTRFEDKKPPRVSLISKVFRHPEQCYRCPVCFTVTGKSKTFYSIYSLKYHLITFHKDELCETELTDFRELVRQVQYLIKLRLLAE